METGEGLRSFARILFDITFWDSTSHNLAPFEIIFYGIFIVPSAIAGGYIGLLINKMAATQKN
jgi:hypothetical protein